MRRARLLVLAALLAGALGIVLERSGVIEPYEADTVDARFAVRGAQPVDGFAVVAIDEDTFSELRTTWPLDRRRHAKVVDRLRAAGAKLIVYDVQFTERSGDDEADFALYDAIGRAGGAVLATAESDRRGRTAVLGGDESLRQIDSVAAAANMPSDRAGVVRRYSRSVGKLRTIATTVAARLGRPVPRDAFDPDGEAWIDFRGPEDAFPTYSFSDVHEGRVGADELRDRIVVVGASAPTLQDVHATATTDGVEMSGPELQANAIATALAGNPLRSAPWWVDILTIIALAVVAPAVARRRRLAVVVLAAVAVGAVHLVVAQVAFENGVVVSVLTPLVALLAATFATVVTSYLVATVERRIVARSNERLEREVHVRTADLRDAQLELVQRLAQAAERRDGDTGEHIERMSEMCERLALAAGLPPFYAEMLRHAAVLHDVGKIAIPDRILLKQGPLDDDEMALMRTHCRVGADMLAGSSSPMLQMAEVVALTHHERWDGTGYPEGLAGDAIPMSGRISALCDVFDALTSERPYKEAWTAAEALEEIRGEAGSHFDPDLTAAFLRLFDHPSPLEAARPPGLEYGVDIR